MAAQKVLLLAAVLLKTFVIMQLSWINVYFSSQIHLNVSFLFLAEF